jgi:protein-tyrosine-phosphatase/predicted ATP-grasp superfamily ATP-dependent carboligase
VLIVGTAPRVALAVARSLAKRGISVAAVPSSADEGSIPTSAIARYIALPDARSQPDDFDAGLERAVRRTGAQMLMACSDKALGAIARNYATLRALADPGCPPPEITAGVLDKTITIAAARRLAIDVPVSYDSEALAQGGAALDALAYPLIAKPKNHAGLGGIRLRYFREPSDLDTAIRADADFAAKYMVQQFVAGTGVGVAVLMRAGVPAAAFVHRRVKELPAAGGVSVVSESVAPDAALVDKAVGLLRALRWEGVALVEFRRAPDGTAWLMEINGRYWGSLSTAIAAGIDFPYYHWQAARGEIPEPPTSYPAGVRVRWTRGAILRLRERLFERSGMGQPRAGGAEELRSFWADLSPPVRSAMWKGADPLPAVVDVMPALWRFSVSALRAAVKRVVPRGLARAYADFGVRGALQFARGPRTDLPQPFAPRSVLFVCSGNIMRSALAAAAFAQGLRALGARGVAVDSCGLHAAPGTPADPRALESAAAAGLDLRDHRAKLMNAALAAGSDAIFAMDRLQLLELRRRFPETHAYTFLLGASVPGRPAADIPDPYLADDAHGRAILALVKERATELAGIVARATTPLDPAGGEIGGSNATGAGAG